MKKTAFILSLAAAVLLLAACGGDKPPQSGVSGKDAAQKTGAEIDTAKGSGAIPVTPAEYTLSIKLKYYGGSVILVAEDKWCTNVRTLVDVPANTPFYITAAPEEGYGFVGWAVDKGPALFSSMDSAATAVTLSADAAIIAKFKRAAEGPPGSQFNPNITYSSFTDSRDGKKYRTVKIGSKTWMAENLNFSTRSRNFYDDDTSSLCHGFLELGDTSDCAVYGRLYLGESAMNACPDGWRLPDGKDWDNLAKAVGGRKRMLAEDETYLEKNYYWIAAGEKLKSKTGWDDYTDENGRVHSGNGTDDFGFSALPGSSFLSLFSMETGKEGGWWAGGGNIVVLDHGKDLTFDNVWHCASSVATNWYSVRCIKK